MSAKALDATKVVTPTKEHLLTQYSTVLHTLPATLCLRCKYSVRSLGGPPDTQPSHQSHHHTMVQDDSSIFRPCGEDKAAVTRACMAREAT